MLNNPSLPDLGVDFIQSDINAKEYNKNTEIQVAPNDKSLVPESVNSNNNENSSKEDNIFKNSIYSAAYDNDVVFGSKDITQSSMKNFVMEYPDSALKYIFRKNLDGRPLI